ncbi:MAG: hypothetical protein ACYC77_03975 [Coriobacteriia bacterium]
MLAAAIAALVGSMGAAYLIGYVIVAPRDSYWREKRGMWTLVVLGLTFIPLPPQMTVVDVALGPMMGTTGLASSGAAAWPTAIGKQAYLVVWVVTSLVALLVGMRVWNAGKADWRGEPSRAFDSSAGARATSLLPMADTLDDSLDVLGRAGLVARDVPGIAADVRDVGRRFAASLPDKDGDVYALVSKRLSGELASTLTGLLLEGAGRRGPRG